MQRLPADIQGTWIPLNESTYSLNNTNTQIDGDHVCRGKMKIPEGEEYVAGWPMKDTTTKKWQCMMSFNHSIVASVDGIETLIADRNYTWQFNNTNIPVVIAENITTKTFLYPICKPQLNFQFIGMLHGEECCYNFPINGTENCENHFHLITVVPQ